MPKEILMGQGTNMTSKLMQELRDLLKIKELSTFVYHSQTDGLVECFNKTLKETLWKFVAGDL